MTICISGGCCLAICWLLKFTDRVSHKAVSYSSFPVDNNVPTIGSSNATVNGSSRALAVFWSPCGNPALTRLVVNITMNLQMLQECYKNKNELQAALQYYGDKPIIGLQFEDELAQKENFSKTLNVEVRFPELPVSSQSSTHWLTAHIFPLFYETGPREPGEATGPLPYYHKRGFLTLQNHISKGFVENYVHEELPILQMSRFPHPAWKSYEKMSMIRSLCGVVLLMGVLKLFSGVLRDVAIEKETQIKEIMKIMGINNWLHWTAWYLSTILFSLLIVLLNIVILTSPITKGYPVFSNVNRMVLFVFFIVYVSTMITSAFAVTVFFSRANMATIVGEVFFLATMIPSFLSVTFSEKLSSCLLMNSAFLYGIEIIIDYEMVFKNLTMDNIFDPVSEKESLSLGLVVMMLILDMFIYMLIVLYVEAIFPGEYGLPRVWYFPCTPRFWCRNLAVSERVIETFVREDNYYEPEPTGQKIGIQVLHLKKQYGKHRIVLRNLSFNMFEGEVTILLGHNGAGKTTTMSILSGILPASYGTAIINGYDIRTDMNKIRRSLGFCPQHDVLFDLLTAREHLYFYCIVRGLRGQMLKEEINKYLQLLDFTNKKEVVAKSLSGGMKRKLCTGIALCGNSKICILDEPTSGMDPTNRRLLWDFIQSEKAGRTILLSTHFMNEADVLGDRIAILANGMLQCYGSSYFLKKRYGSGYRLVIVKDAQCKVEEITAFLRQYIPRINLETNVGRELTYILPESYVGIFERMLGDMDNKRKSLGIETYGISLATLEEVFMKVGTEYDEQNENPSKTSLEAGSDNKYKYLTGFSLYINQILAMILKRALITMRSWLIFIAITVLAVLASVLVMNSWRTSSRISASPRLDFTLDSYNTPITVITTTSKENPYYKNYRKLLLSENREVVDRGNEDMNDYLLKKTSESMEYVRTHFIIGATFLGNNTIVAWFNDKPFHSPPLALQYVYNAILREKIGPDYSIQFGNYPFRENIQTADTGLAFLYNIMTICMFVTYVCPYYILFCVKERICRSKHLQLASGTNVSIFWFVTFVWDLASFIFVAFWVITVMMSYKAQINYGAVIALIIVFGFAILPFIYLVAFLFRRPSSAYSAISLFILLVAIAFYILRVIVDRQKYMVLKIVDGLFLYFPVYSLLCGVHNVSRLYNWNEMCDNVNKQFEQVGEKNITVADYACFKAPEMCCDLGYYSMGNGISKSLIYMVTSGVIFFLLLFIHEYGVRGYLVYIFTFFLRKPPKTEGTEDADVLEEKRQIRQGIIDPSTHEVLMKDITKYFKRFLAVNQLCIGVKQYECFGLLGVNGAGKTTLFRMMTGDLRSSYGDGWICRFNIKNNMKDIHRFIGYCPQFDGLLDNLTVKETLIMYCLIRGLPVLDCSAAAIRLSKELQFNKHIKKNISNLSGGSKRKVSAAISLIGEPPVIFLDEPSTGMDPTTKRFLWDKLCRIRDNGRCLVLTTHSMDECEAVCTRVGIMVNGAFQCLGSSQYLKNKFADGYVLIIKVKKGENPQVLENNINDVKRFVDTSFRDAELKERHGRLLSYIVKSKRISWSAIFGIMERGKIVVKTLEDYSLSQFDLEQIFLLFTRMQGE
ncbi:ABC transporter [Popillia japonica]|uniref:ABC transporter n=1 Tax=Popillia japonica TaxID=7064 RepID=A0AAW1M0S6_POPJA